MLIGLCGQFDFSWWMMPVAAFAHPDQGDEGVLVRQLGRQAHGAPDQEDPRRPRVCLQARGVGSL